jgi:hypothetical protein
MIAEGTRDDRYDEQQKEYMKGCSKEAALFYAGGLAIVSICKCQIVTVVTPSYHPLEPDDRSTYTIHEKSHRSSMRVPIHDVKETI